MQAYLIVREFGWAEQRIRSIDLRSARQAARLLLELDAATVRYAFAVWGR